MSNRRIQSLRSLARQIFRSVLASEIKPKSVRPIRFEPLERREVMAGDFFDSALSVGTAPDSDSSMTSGLSGEGEAANDLVAFAKALATANVKLYGTAWNADTTQQRNLFEDGGKFLPFFELTNPDRSPNALGTSTGITTYPTWEFQGGVRVTGVLTLQQIASNANIAIPTSSTPSIDTIPTQTLLIGSPLHVPVDAYDPNGNPLVITVTSNNPSVVSAEVLNGNRSLVLSTEGYGDMVFELFESEAPRATSRIIELAQAGFFNKTTTNQVTYHRVIDNFVIQAGDPTGTGSGGSVLGDFDDQYDVDLQHNRTGILSFAKSSDDTNDSQFFVTEGPQRNLDFNHSVFGQLVEGELIRNAISGVPVASSTNKPTTNVVISSATVISDAENGMIRLKAVGGQTGTAIITVTVQDSEGNSTQQSFSVTVSADNKNSAPFLNDIAVPTAVAGSPVSIQLTSQDVEGDPVYYDATVPTGSQYTVAVDHTTGLVTLTPNSGFTGAMTATLGVRAATSADTVDTFDTQLVTIATTPVAPTGIDLQDASDTGSSNSDNTTNAGTLTFIVSGTTSGATVELRRDSTVVGTAVATGTTTTITTANIAGLGAGTYSLVATQTVGTQRSVNSPTLQLIYDNVQPVALATGVIPATGNVGTPISIDLSHTEEGAGLAYSLQNAPSGMTINATSGLLQWTPTSTQTGAQTFTVVLTDKAGNSRTQAFTTTIGAEAQGRISLRLVDTSGNPIASASVGQNFKVQVYVEDLRTTESGVFAAFLDLIYNSSVVEVVGTTPISHGTTYTNSPTGDTATVGLVNELGGVANSTAPLGEGAKLLAEVTMRTKSVGQAAFTAETAEGNGTQFLLYGINTAIPNEQVNFGTASLAVGLNFAVANDTFSVNEDSASTSLDLLLNDAINTGSGAVLTIQSVSTGSASGTITIPSGGKSVSYKPAANFNGSETFTYVVANQDGATQTATVTVQVQSVNDAPVAVADAIEFIQDTTGNVILVLQNDNSGPDNNETLRVSSIGTPSSGGTATITSSGNTITYAPKAGFIGTETLSYTISDNGDLTSTATITITVKPSVPPPTAVNDSYSIVEDAPSAEFDVLINDTPSQTGETLSITAVVATNGTASVTTDGKKINFSPTANFNGSGKVTYTLRGSLGGTTTGTATFTVSAVNDAPTAVNDSLTANSINASTTLSPLANDTNVDTGETLTIASVTQPASGSGTISISSDSKSILYVPPNNNFSGTATFDYTISDGNGLTSTATATLVVSSFVMRDIGGVLDFDTDALNSNSFYTNLILEGSTFQNQAISQTIVPSGNSFLASNLAPGDYTIKPVALPFIEGAATQGITIKSNPTDGSSTSNKLEIGSVSARYFDVRDFMGKSVGHSLTVAVAPGQSQSWASGSGDWKNFKKINTALSSDSKSLTITATRNDNQVVQGTVSLTNANTVDLRGSDANDRLFKLRMKPTDITLTPTTSSTNSSSASGEGEGEGEGESNGFLVSPTTNSVNASPISSSSIGSEQEARDEAFRQIRPSMELVSPAGDLIATQIATGDDQEDAEAIDSIFDSVEEVLE